jgi:hypothetical protein
MLRRRSRPRETSRGLAQSREEDIHEKYRNNKTTNEQGRKCGVQADAVEEESGFKSRDIRLNWGEQGSELGDSFIRSRPSVRIEMILDDSL